MLSLVVSHIVDNKFYSQICFYAMIVNGLGIIVCYGCDGLCILVEISFKLHHSIELSVN